MGLLGAMAGLGKGLSMVAEDNLRGIQRNEEAAASDERQRRLAEWKMKMEQEYAIDKENRQAAQKQAEEKRFADTADKVDTRSKEIGTDRRFQKFLQDGKQAGYFEGMSTEQVKEVFDQTYDDKRVNAQEGGDRYQDKTLAVKADDYVKAARETGNPGLLTQALNDRKTAIGQDNTNATNAFKEREAKRKEEADRVREEQRDEQLAIQNKSVTAAIARSGSSGSDKGISDALKFLDSQRKGWSSELADLKDRRKALDSAMGMKKDEKLAKLQAIEDEQKAIKAKIADADEKYGQLSAKLFDDKPSSKPSASKPTGGQLPSLPAGAKQIGTSGGKPVYETPDGKRFIQR